MSAQELVHEAPAEPRYSFCVGVGGVVSKPRPQGVVNPGKRSVCIVMGRIVKKPSLWGQTHTAMDGVVLR